MKKINEKKPKGAVSDEVATKAGTEPRASYESGPASEMSTGSVISERDEVKQAEERLRQKIGIKNKEQ